MVNYSFQMICVLLGLATAQAKTLGAYPNSKIESSKMTFSQDINLTGKNYFIKTEALSADSKYIAKIEKFLSSALESNGFLKTKKSMEAHLLILLGSQELSFEDEYKQSVEPYFGLYKRISKNNLNPSERDRLQKETVKLEKRKRKYNELIQSERAKGKLIKYYFGGYSQEYGKRFKNVFYGDIRFYPKGSKSRVAAKDEAIEKIGNMKKLRPKQALLDPKRLPGCLPVLGLELKQDRSIPIIENWFVSRVTSGGGADKAGIRAGDQLLSINNKKYADPTFKYSQEPKELVEHYNSGKPFRIEIMRDRKSILKEVETSISCKPWL